jgi:probable rRNA maturation factor
MIQETAARIMTKEQKKAANHIHVIFCSNVTIKKLNAEFRKKNKATDVLSFNYNEPDLLGEIYISVEKAFAQCKKFGNSYKQELNRLFVHGMFHLLGYDHETEPERKKMEKKEAPYL